MKTEWHWIRNNDFPKDGQDVWCCYKSSLNNYCCTKLMFVNDLYELDEYYFIEYKDKKQSSFVAMDGEWGWCKWDGVICWCELPTVPDELRNENVN